MKQIVKQDSTFEQLNQNQVIWLGDTDLFEKMFNKTTGAQVTLRFIAKEGIGRQREDQTTANFQLLLILKHDDLNFIQAQNLFEEIRKIQYELFLRFHQHVPAITCRPTLSATPEFGIYQPKSRNCVIVSADELHSRLIKHEPALASATRGCTKQANAGCVDDFQLFTRNYLPSNCCINDIDAIAFNQGKVFSGDMRFIEIKRVTNAPKWWKPYVTDFANYKALSLLTSHCGLLPEHVLVYSKNHPGLALHQITELSMSYIKSHSWLFDTLSSLDDLVLTPAHQLNHSTNGLNR